MAQLTPNDILAISEPIEQIYTRTVDELLINIARHFQISGWERTRYWEIKKLSEMGALTKESAAIIAKNTNMLPSEIEKAFLQVSEKACLDIDPQLREAQAKGIIQGVESDATSSILMRQMVQGYVDQATDTMNMINTTMLESTRQAYLKGVTTAVNTAMLDEAKAVLESEALAVVTGAETRVRAIRKAMNAITATGIAGFYDRSGRGWSPEAYAAMVVRTTAHNAAISAVRTRQKEFGGGDIFQVSSHPAARPLCYPYQGKFFSWSTSGEFTDGAGHTHKYDFIENSSYGEPAGLFGINCGHHPIPMIPNFSYPQDGPTETEAENAKEYEESQKQRAYERQIREAKRDLEIAKATGDEDAIKAAKQKVAQKQANMRAFTKETGRARRYDREKIGGTKDIEGYKGYRAQFASDEPLNKPDKKADVTTLKYKEATNDEYLKLGNDIRKNVPKAEQEQIHKHKKADGSSGGYVATTNYKYINTNLRKGRDISTGIYDDDDVKTIQALRNAINASTLDDNYIATRYVNAEYLTQEFGVMQTGFKGKKEPINNLILTFSNTHKMEPAITQELQKQIGKTHSDSGFLSASLLPDKNIMQDKAVMIKMHAPSGTHAYIPKNRKESEIIFGENTQRYIGNIYFDNSLDKWVIEEYIMN